MTDDRDTAPELLPRALLEEWTVPEMPETMKERVMAQLDESWRMSVTPTPRTPPRYLGATFIAVAALAASVGAIVIGLHADDPPELPVAAAPVEPIAVQPHGHLTIATEPADAVVEVDGLTLPGPSPFVATGLAVGPHEVRVHRDGHIAWSRVVDVPATQLHLPIVLASEPIEGAVLVGDAEAGAEAGAETPKPRPKRPTADPLAHPLGEPLAEAEVRGSLDREAIRRVVRAHLQDVHDCYAHELARDPGVSGRVAIQFTIGPTGKVTTAVVAASTFADPALPNCIAKAVKRWTFPAPKGGGNVVVTYPFILEPG